MRHLLVSAAALALLAAPASGRAQSSAQPGPDASMAAQAGEKPDKASAGQPKPGAALDLRALTAQSDKLKDSDIATAPIREIRRTSHHTVTIGGKQIAYTATAGTLTIRDDDGKPTASMFYVAYTAGADHDPHRPVTFFYNGGPGSSSVWLHMGSLAPVRVRTDSPQATHNAPFDLGPNPDSLLDKSDLVFVDAIGAGFSRPLGDTKLAAFWGTDPDIDAFARGIERYLTVNDRWNAPKFIFGESYGTTRSAGLAYRLQKDGAQLNGVILLSSILNYGRRDPGFDQELINYIPSYAATAAYHHRSATQPNDLAAYLKAVRDWARGPYALALAKGQDLSPAERQQIADQMAGYTGLPAKFILDSDLRVDLRRFLKEELRDQRRTLGRYDSRFTGMDVDAAGESPEYDPSDTGISGAFVSSFHDYLSRELGYQTDLSYRPTFYSSGVQWNFTHKPPVATPFQSGNPADVAQDLSAAMRENPHLLVYSLNGLYDMATPFFGTEYDLGHMQIDPSLRANLRFAYYPSGHMVYLNPDALKAMKADLARFYDEAAPQR
ncbi:S10 family peptidase [Phenylobacterium montanum]|uniref:Peptidase S10 n=1 Tax=Phenylobacterium montanum TaxID=2823693 RepID=A0A975FYE5_9CAUL|nr:peptidase S10 [Caulobacter sp. S6]QUD87264.1 peptidase S10 [Caulobacter sp. S6]